MMVAGPGVYFHLGAWVLTIESSFGDVWPEAKLGAAGTVSPH